MLKYTARQRINDVWLLVVLGLGLGALAAPVTAQEAKLDQKAQQTLQGMADHFRQAQRFAVEVRINSKVEVGPRTREQQTTARFLVEKPDKYRIDFDAGGNEGMVLSNGEKVVVLHHAWSQFTRDEAGEPFGHQMMDMLLAKTLVAEKPYEGLMAFVKGGRHAGVQKVEGVKADRLMLETDNGELELLVAEGDRPRPLKMETEQEIAMGPQAKGTMRTRIDFANWNFAPEIAEDAFAFRPQDDMKKVERFEPPSAKQLIGKPAPHFKLKTPGGETVKLSEHKGEDVVVLDFWATWCGPCIRGLPIVQSVVNEFSEKNVAFYAVNIEESAAQVRQFEKKHEMDLPVLLDSDRRVANAYYAFAIPQTVLIGEDGVVQAVHTGIRPDTEATLRRELKKLLAGEDLQ
jgi:hypothetical protein